MHALTRYHEGNPETHHVYAWNERTAMVELSGWLVTLVPLGDAPHEGEPPGERRKYMREFLETPPVTEARMTLAALTQWALRKAQPRFREDNWLDGYCDWHRPADHQTFGGAIFNRDVIRESLQWLHESRVDMGNEVHLRLVPSPPATGGHRILVMSCSDWTAVVMCCRADTSHGNDPLEAK